MELFELFNLAYDIVDEWKETEAYIAVKEALARLKDDPQGKDEIAMFVRCRDDYRLVEQYGKHVPDANGITERFIRAKDRLFSDPLYLDYMEKLTAFNKLTGQFAGKIESILEELKIGETKKHCR